MPPSDDAIIAAVREVLSRPTTKGLIALASTAWAALVNGAPELLLIATGLGFFVGVMDTLLGIYKAIRTKTFRRHGFAQVITKGINYSALYILALAIGMVVDAVLGSVLGSDRVQVTYLAPSAVALILFVNESLSALDHIDEMTGHKIPLTAPRLILRRLQKMQEKALEELADQLGGEGGDVTVTTTDTSTATPAGITHTTTVTAGPTHVDQAVTPARATQEAAGVPDGGATGGPT